MWVVSTPCGLSVLPVGLVTLMRGRLWKGPFEFLTSNWTLRTELESLALNFKVYKWFSFMASSVLIKVRIPRADAALKVSVQFFFNWLELLTFRPCCLLSDENG